MSNYMDIVKQGYLKVKSKKMGMWQKKWLILRKASSKGATRLERYADEKASMLSYEAKIIDLTFVERIEKASEGKQTHMLILCFTNGEAKQFAASSDMDVTDWYDVLTANIGAAASASNATFGGQKYRSLPHDMFHVYLLPNTNTEYGGEYLIQVTAESIILKDALYPGQVLVTWKLNTLRRYGRDGAKFTFEAGRSSETGEGLFIFTSVDCERVYQKVHTATQALVTVKNMTRRQQEGSMADGTVLGVSRSLTRHHSDSDNIGGHGGGGVDWLDSEYRDTKSLPVSPVRGPMATPRRKTEETEADANANTQYLYSTPQENRTPEFTQQLSRTNSRPLPPAPIEVSTSYTNGEADPDTYIYEEKGLSRDFRKFLAGRKGDDDS